MKKGSNECSLKSPKWKLRPPKPFFKKKS